MGVKGKSKSKDNEKDKQFDHIYQGKSHQQSSSNLRDPRHRPHSSMSRLSATSTGTTRTTRRRANNISDSEKRELAMLRQHDKMVVRRVAQTLLDMTKDETMLSTELNEFREELARVNEDCRYRMKRVLQNRRKELRILG